jgi:hypothetical protein
MVSEQVTDAKCVVHYTDTIKQSVRNNNKVHNNDTKSDPKGRTSYSQRKSSILDPHRTSIIESRMETDPSLNILNTYMAAKSRLKCENPYHVPQNHEPLLFTTEEAREEHGKYLGELAHKCQICDTVPDKKQEIGVHFAKYHPHSKMRYCHHCDGYYEDQKHTKHVSINNEKHVAGQKTIRRFSTHATKKPNRTTVSKYGLDYAKKHSMKYQTRRKLTKVCDTCGYAMMEDEQDHRNHLYCYDHHHTIPMPQTTCTNTLPKTDELLQCPVCLTVDTYTHQTHQFCRDGRLLPPKRSMSTSGTCNMSRDVDIAEGLEYCELCKFPFHKRKPHTKHVRCADSNDIFPLHHHFTAGKNCVVTESDDE